MARASADVQEQSTGSHQDIEDAGVDDMLDVLFPERGEVYHGPDAFTVSDLARPGLSRHAVTRRAEKAVERGDLIEVLIERRDSLNRIKWWRAWVKKETYDGWKKENNDDAGLD